MNKPKLIILDGAQAVGKTTITNWLREQIPYTDFHRLSGHNDKTISGLEKSKCKYYNELDYIWGNEEVGNNLIYDRFFTSEQVYCELGFRDYSFTEVFKKLVEGLDQAEYDIYLINLYLKDISLFKQRLKRDKKEHLNVKFNIESSVAQQNKYKEVVEYIKNNTKNIKVYHVASDDTDECKKEILDILNIK